MGALTACCAQRPKNGGGGPPTTSAFADALARDPRNLRAEEAALQEELARLNQSPDGLDQSQGELQQVLLQSLDGDEGARRAEAQEDEEWQAAVAASIELSKLEAQMRSSAAGLDGNGAAVETAAAGGIESEPWQPEPEPWEPEPEKLHVG